MFDKLTKTFKYGEHTVHLETGEVARQATGSVLVSVWPCASETVKVTVRLPWAAVAGIVYARVKW